MAGCGMSESMVRTICVADLPTSIWNVPREVPNPSGGWNVGTGSARAFDWAGFVLVGEGTTRVKLVARSGFGPLEGSALALAAALVAAFVALGLRRLPGLELNGGSIAALLKLLPRRRHESVTCAFEIGTACH